MAGQSVDMDPVMREFANWRKPIDKEPLSDCDALEYADEYLAHGVPFPPKDYKLLTTAAQQRIQDLEAFQQAQVPNSFKDHIKESELLIQNATPKDVTRAKLQSYYQSQGNNQQDRTDAAAFQGPASSRPLGVSIPLCGYSDESEWAEGWNSDGYNTKTRLEMMLQAVLDEYGNVQAPKHACPCSSATKTTHIQEVQPIREYNPDYLLMLDMQRKLDSQNTQRRMAFLAPLVGVVLLSGLRWLKGLRSKNTTPKPGNAAQ